MRTINTKFDFKNNEGIEITQAENSMLVVARRKIIIPQNKIIIEDRITPSMLMCQQPYNEEFSRTSGGIYLSKKILS